MYWFQVWPPGDVTPGGATCIATLPWIALLASSVSIELVSSSARVTSTKSTKALVDRDIETPRPIDRTPETPGSGKKQQKIAIAAGKALDADGEMLLQHC